MRVPASGEVITVSEASKVHQLLPAAGVEHDAPMTARVFHTRYVVLGET